MKPATREWVRCAEEDFDVAGARCIRMKFGRKTGDLNGSLSGSARFTLLLTNYGQR
jgi:hypothetical protein